MSLRARSNSQTHYSQRADTVGRAEATPLGRPSTPGAYDFQQRPSNLPRSPSTIGRAAGSSVHTTPRRAPLGSAGVSTTPLRSLPRPASSNASNIGVGGSAGFGYARTHAATSGATVTPTATTRLASLNTSSHALRRPRRLSEASPGTRSASTWHEHHQQQQRTSFQGLSPAFTASASVSAAALHQHNQHLSAHVPYSASASASPAVDPYHQYTPTPAERRPDSRSSVYSTGSAAQYAAAASLSSASGKTPIYVRSVKLDFKVVPPALDAQKKRRRRIRQEKPPLSPAQFNSKNSNSSGSAELRSNARVRVRLDVLVNVLHPGEQRIDLLNVADNNTLYHNHHAHQPSSIAAGRFGRRRDSQASCPGVDCAAQCWPHVERTTYAVSQPTPETDHAELNPSSPLVSPKQQPRQTDGFSPAPVPVSQSAARKSAPRAKPSPTFHVDEVSPYPPAPFSPSPPPATQMASNDGLPAARFETHTLASYARATARVSDRIALYNELSSTPPRRPSLLIRRAQSVSVDLGGGGGGGGNAQDKDRVGLGLRPASAMDSYVHSRQPVPAAAGALSRQHVLQHNQQQNHLGSALGPNDRPHSSMALITSPHRRSSDAVSAQDDAPQHASTGFAEAVAMNGGQQQHQLPLCTFETDYERGVLYARLYEPRSYRLTVWFSVSSAANTAPLVTPPTPGAAWESGSLSLSGLPRSLQTRVRVRLPHRSQHDASTEATGPCFFRARMEVPPRIDPHNVRTVDARLASTATTAGASRALSAAILSPSTDNNRDEQDNCGWLLTDDSDISAHEFESPPAPGDDPESVLDRKLQRFIDEYGPRGSLSLDATPPPALIDSDGNLSVPQTAAADEIDSEPEDRQSSWSRFALENGEWDFQRTELTTFKLRMTDTVCISWAPRSVFEYAGSTVRRSLSSATMAPIIPMSIPVAMPALASDELHNHLADPPARPYPTLDTIFSAEPTPVIDYTPVDSPPQSQSTAAASATMHPHQEQIKGQRQEQYSKPDPLPTIGRIDSSLILTSGGLQVKTKIQLGLEPLSDSSLLFRWPATVDLDFAPLLCAIRGARSVPLVHQNVSVSCLGKDAERVCWASGSALNAAASSAHLSSGDFMPASHLRLWIPAADCSDYATIDMTVESVLEMAISLSGMMLTPRFYVGVPVQPVSLVLPSASAASGNVSGVRATISIDNQASLWVRVVMADSDGIAADLLALVLSDQLHQVVVVEHKQSPSAAVLPRRLIEAYAKTTATTTTMSAAPSLDSSSDRSDALAVTTASDSANAPSAPYLFDLGINVDAELHGADPVDLSLADADANAAAAVQVHAVVSCSLALFSSWRDQLLLRTMGHQDNEPLIPCAVFSLPSTGTGDSWCIQRVEQANRAIAVGSADGNGNLCDHSSSGNNINSFAGDSMDALAAVVNVDDTTVAIPLVQQRQSCAASQNLLTPELTSISLKVYFSVRVPANELVKSDPLELRLPSPLFDYSTNNRGFEKTVFAKLSKSDDFVARLSASISSGRSIEYTRGSSDTDSKGADSSHHSVVCTLGPVAEKLPTIVFKKTLPLSSCENGLPRLCLHSLPSAAPVEFVSRSTDTDDLPEPTRAQIESESKSSNDEHEQMDDTAAVSCISSAPSDSDQCYLQQQECQQHLAADVQSIHSVARHSSFSGSIGGSLRNRHPRPRSNTDYCCTQPPAPSNLVDREQQFATVVSESQPLLGSPSQSTNTAYLSEYSSGVSGLHEHSSDLLNESDGAPASALSRAWRWVVWAMWFVLFLALTAVALYAATELFVEIPSTTYPQQQPYHKMAHMADGNTAAFGTHAVAATVVEPHHRRHYSHVPATHQEAMVSEVQLSSASNPAAYATFTANSAEASPTRIVRVIRGKGGNILGMLDGSAQAKQNAGYSRREQEEEEIHES
ncbi:hypothetical protein GGI07_005484, partial [Coemansia sp. Benny D115]